MLISAKSTLPDTPYDDQRLNFDMTKYSMQ